MKLISQLQKSWKSVAMNFIVKLLKSKDLITKKEYNSILTITDWLMKYAMFISMNEATDASGTAHLMIWNVIANESLSDEWITDRDSKFMSHFWQTLMRKLEVKHKASTAYHSQTNRQNEQLNQTLKQYLWNYIDYNQTN